VPTSRATGTFARHGVRTLLVSKFIVGLDAVAVPLTGAARIPPTQFLVFDALGAMFWSSAYAALGYIFSDQLDRVAAHVVGMGTVVVLAVTAGLSFHIVRNVARWQRWPYSNSSQTRPDAVKSCFSNRAVHHYDILEWVQEQEKRHPPDLSK